MSAEQLDGQLLPRRQPVVAVTLDREPARRLRLGWTPNLSIMKRQKSGSACSIGRSMTSRQDGI
jgi:hypothetical protein